MTFGKDLLERALKTFLQFMIVLSAAVQAFPLDDVRHILDQLDTEQTVGLALGGAVLSAVMSWVSKFRGSRQSASLVKT